MFNKLLKYNVKLRIRKYCSIRETRILTINDMPQPASLPLLGTLLSVFAAGGGTKIHEYVDKRHKQLGPVFRENFNKSDIVFVKDPMLLKQLFLKLEGKYPEHILPDPWIMYGKLYDTKRGLLFMDGLEWLSHRRIMNKYLLRDDETWMEKPIKSTITRFIDNLKNNVKNNKNKPDLESDLYKVTIEGIITILIGSNYTNKVSHHFEELLSEFSKSVHKIFLTTTNLFGMPLVLCERLNLKVWREFKECVDDSLYLGRKLAKEMLENQNENDGLISKLSKENISDDTIIRLIVDFIIAAGDTSSFTLLWCLYLISKHKEVLTEIRQRDNLYIKNVIRESMRLFPVAPFITRILPKPSLLGPYMLKEGTAIAGSIYTSGRDENYFSKANEFLPYRWDKNDERRSSLKNHEPSASLPFAMGARSCIGKKIAVLQLTEFIKQIAENFDFLSQTNHEIKAKTSGLLVPDKPLDLVFSVRHK